MTDHAVIQGRYADLKFIRTRSVCQIVIEVPIEDGGKVMDALGPPLPSAEVPVAIARLDPAAKPQKHRKAAAPSRRWDELTCAQQAGIRCGETAFSRFLKENLVHAWACSNGDPVEVVREVCDVDSRAQLDDDAEAAKRWRDLDDGYQAWLRIG